MATKQITIGVSQKVFQIVPGYRRVVVVAKRLKNGPSSQQLRRLLEQEIERVRRGLPEDDPRIACWREAFDQAGIKSKKFKPSIDALVHRIQKGGTLPSISTVVDIGTVLSLRHVLPCGAHSLNDVEKELQLRLATGSEQFTPFGASEAESVKTGEIIFTDGDLVATNKWAWRQASHTIIQPATTAFELNIDALEVIVDSELHAIIADARKLIKQFLNVHTEVYILNETVPSVHFKL